jgi:Flp pilus assembly protein TadG
LWIAEMNIRPRTKFLVKRRHERKATAAVEFAFIAPLLILMVMGAIDVGQSVNVAQVVNDASREGARQASRMNCVNANDVELAVRAYLADAYPSVPTNELFAALTVNVSNSTGSGIDMTTIESGSPVTVQVILEYDVVRWMAGIPGFGGISIETSTVMRRE